MASEQTRSAISEAKELRHRRLVDAGLAGIAQRRRVPRQLTRRLDLCRHVGEPERHRLVVGDRCAEALALSGICRRRGQGGAGHTDGLRSNADAPAFKIGQRNSVSLAFLPQQQIRCELHLVEDDLRRVGGALTELVLEPGDAPARRRRRHDECADAFLRRRRIGDGEDDGDFGMGTRGDELLDAAQHILVAGTARPRLDRRGVGAGLRLGQAEGGQHLAARHRLQEALLLLWSAELQQRQPTELCTLMIVKQALSPAAISSSANAYAT
jgi:hypothetical protein